MDDLPVKRKRDEASPSCTSQISATQRCGKYDALSSLLLPHSTVQRMASTKEETGINSSCGDLTTPFLLDAVCSALVKDVVEDVRAVSFTSPQMRYCLSRCPWSSFQFLTSNNRIARASSVGEDDDRSTATTAAAARHIFFLLHKDVYDFHRGLVVPQYCLHVNVLSKFSMLPLDVPASKFTAIKVYLRGYMQQELEGNNMIAAQVVHPFVTENDILVSSCSYSIELNTNSRTDDNPTSLDNNWTLTIQVDCTSELDTMIAPPSTDTNCFGIRYWDGDVVLDKAFFLPCDVAKEEFRCAYGVHVSDEETAEAELRLSSYKPEGKYPDACPPRTPQDLFNGAHFRSLTLSPFWEGLLGFGRNFCAEAQFLHRIDVSACKNILQIDSGFLEKAERLREVDLRQMKRLKQIHRSVNECRQLERLHLPENTLQSMEKVGNNCPKLTVDLSEQSAMHTLHYLFEDICGIRRVVFPHCSLRSLCTVFCGNTTLVELDLSECCESLTELGVVADGCPVLERVTLGDLPNLRTMGGNYDIGSSSQTTGLFTNCPSLTRVDMGRAPDLLWLKTSVFVNTPMLEQFDLVSVLRPGSNSHGPVAHNVQVSKPFLEGSLVATRVDWVQLFRVFSLQLLPYIFISYLHHRRKYVDDLLNNEAQPLGSAQSGCDNLPLPQLKYAIEQVVCVLQEYNAKARNTQPIDLYEESEWRHQVGICIAAAFIKSVVEYLPTVKPLEDEVNSALTPIFAETMKRLVEASCQDTTKLDLGFAYFGSLVARWELHCYGHPRKASVPHAFASLLHRSAKYYEGQANEGWQIRAKGAKMAAYLIHSRFIPLEEEVQEDFSDSSSSSSDGDDDMPPVYPSTILAREIEKRLRRHWTDVGYMDLHSLEGAINSFCHLVSSFEKTKLY